MRFFKNVCFLIVVFFCPVFPALAQHQFTIEATLNPAEQSLEIEQEIIYKNTSRDSLTELFFFDWANSFSSKTSPLAKRFAEEYISSFHFERSANRGRTTIEKIASGSEPLQWTRGDEVDILKIIPRSPVLPGAEYRLNLKYTVKFPSDKFTGFGADKDRNFKLRYWYLTPAVYDGTWQIYSNVNTDDLYQLPGKFEVRLQYPDNYFLSSDLETEEEISGKETKTTVLKGENRRSAVLYFEKNPSFETIGTDKFDILTNLQHRRLDPAIQAYLTDRVIHFLDARLGPYPFKKMLISETDYRTNPVYGFNLLPDFISPFPDGFEYDMEQLKTITRHYIQNSLIFNSRTDYWLQDALQIYLMMQYVDSYYPNMKIAGNLSNWWAVRWAHASQMEFNDQYPFLYLNMARNNLHQPLTAEKDRLLKFNHNIANPYYGGTGLRYLADFLGNSVLDEAISDFFKNYRLKPVTTSDFQNFLKTRTALPVAWFFEDYAGTRNTIDFTIKKVEKEDDSLRVFIRNKRETTLPVSVYGLDKDKIVFKTWTAPVDSIASVTLPKNSVSRVALNYNGEIPEYNRRNNFKNLKGILNKPIQFRPFHDVENPNYTQFFYIPIFNYNLYDGLSTGVRIYNKTVLPRKLHYGLEPQFGFTSKTLVGSGYISYVEPMDEGWLYSMRYGFSGNYYSYDHDLFYRRFSPFIVFSFRDPDIRNNRRHFLNLRNVNVYRDENPDNPNQAPSYSVFNIKYVYSKPKLINYFRFVVDYQISSKFSKISTEIEFRKLFLSNRQLNLRFFAGTFLFNDSRRDGDYFSFALDRPNDYLFDYLYYGRSESAGLFSQQLIPAEGGFKSKLQPAYSDSWIATLNAQTNIWKWIYAYGDVGLVHHSKKGTHAVYDSGIRVSLVADYFELFFPMYSSLGFEPGLPDYDQKIRFIVTLDPETLYSLFTRRWY